MPLDGSHEVPTSVLELADGADLLIHDAQYTPEEFAEKAHWGHCTVEFAVTVALEAGAKRLALFHHDPTHGDEVVDQMLVRAERAAAGTSLEVLAASEGLTLTLADPLPDPYAAPS